MIGPCGAITTFADGLSPSAELHVATSGDNLSGNGSAGSPFATIERAAQDATPGTAIIVHAGTYAGGLYLTGLRGSAAAPIWIGGAAGEARPVIEGGATGMHLSQISYLVVHDLEVSGPTANGLNVDDGGMTANDQAAHHVIFRNLSIHDVGSTGNQDCLKLSGLNDYVVLYSYMARCGGGSSGSGVDHVGCHRGIIAFNVFEQMAGNAVQAKGGSTDIDLYANRVIDGGDRAFNLGGSTGFEFFRPPLSTTGANAEARRIRAIANVISGSDAAIAFVGCDDCLAAHNTIINPARWTVRILQETVSTATYTFLPSGNSRFINNLVSFRRSDVSVDVNVGPNTAPETFTFANNLWYASDNAGASAPNLPVTEMGGVVGQDPLLDASYAIGGTSPAAGAGLALSEVEGDFDGRCYATPPAIGAFAAP